MGAWGLGPFENDDALDFVADLETTAGTGHLVTILSAIADDLGIYVNASECSSAIAAAEVVAALLGHPNPEQPEEVTRCAAQQAGANEGLAREALRAVERVRERSELRELWEAEVGYPHWKESVADLIARLTFSCKDRPGAL